MQTTASLLYIDMQMAAQESGEPRMLEQFTRFGKNHKAATVRGHGNFAVGQMLEETYQWTSSLEASCKTLYLRLLLSPRDTVEGEGKW
jgi:ribulose-5-phosphate 4-epimerase/fuculose-1-phosphate aldolase